MFAARNLDCRRLRGHSDRFGDRSNFQRQFSDRQRLIGVQHDVLLLESFEPFHRDGQVVLASQQTAEDEIAASVGLDVPCGAGGRIHQRCIPTHHGESARIHHRTDNRSGDRLCLHRNAAR
jgi:hypothetical protein